MPATYNLDKIIDGLSYPASGDDVIKALEENNFPESFMSEFRPMIKDKRFETPDDLHTWLADNMTTHMAGLLGGASVHDLITRAKKTA
ncbi:MAG: DUF2795 domain-containing protein [Firmicutes bacterium]|nr:DUF2795 domain-containing protein [Bacillota bacterium]